MDRITLVKGDVIVIACAGDGRYIAESDGDFYEHAASLIDTDLVVFMGHNAFLDRQIDTVEVTADAARKANAYRKTAVFACYSKDYFLPRVVKTGATPLIFTNSRMAPEAYILDALINKWASGATNIEIHEAVAQAYDKYQKSGINGARKLFYYEK